MTFSLSTYFVFSLVIGIRYLEKLVLPVYISLYSIKYPPGDRRVYVDTIGTRLSKN